MEEGLTTISEILCVVSKMSSQKCMVVCNSIKFLWGNLSSLASPVASDVGFLYATHSDYELHGTNTE